MYPGTFAATAPDRVAAIMSDTGERLTYAQLEERSVRLSRVLHEAGLRRGDTVVIVSENSLRYFEIYWAAQRSGLYVTAVNYHLKPAEIGYIVQDCGAAAVVLSARCAEVAAALADELSGLTRIAFGGSVPGFADYEQALAGASALRLADEPRGQDMLYSSGTTGRPKGVRPPLPERRVDEPGDLYVAVFAPTFGFDQESVYLSPAPLYHAAPLRFTGIVHSTGGTVVVMPRFEPAEALTLIERYRVTHSQWVPTMFVRMLKLPAAERAAHDVSTLRCAIHAAAPCPPEVKRAMIDWWGPILWEYYASTEGNGVTMIDSASWLAKPGSVGKGMLGVIHVCDAEGVELAVGERGLVYFEREVVPFEYHNDPDKTRSAQHPEHPTWTTTGDVGSVDEDGFLFLADRQDFMIISGGVNIYPQEIENVLVSHPSVLDAAVIGVPDEEMGQSVRALVQLVADIERSDELRDALIAHVREELAGFKAPRSLAFVDSLPRTPTGKLVKRLIEDPLASATAVSA